MKYITLLLFFMAWALYTVFIFVMYPILHVSAFNFSLPMVMLGGWLFLYRGAFASSIICIPCHYMMLNYYTDDPAILAEAYNMFGISTQLCFSIWVAKYRSDFLRYQSLQASLEHDVEERTKDLEILAEHIYNVKTDERSKIAASLLDAPQKILTRMERISTLLTTHLHTTEHPKQVQAETISAVIASIKNQLNSLQAVPETIAIEPSNFEHMLKALSVHLHDLSGVHITISSNGEWSQIGGTTLGHLYHIIHEALTNALKHANATDIEIGIRKKEDLYTVYIDNNGKSMTDAALEGMGIPLMRYRASRIGATLHIDYGPENNTVVRCTFPLHKAT